MLKIRGRAIVTWGGRVLRALQQRHRDRQKRVAMAIAHLDELDQTYPDGSFCDLGDLSIQRTAAWEALFSKPEGERIKEGHDGTCPLCGASVDAYVAVCGQCGAIWNKPNDRDVLRSKSIFGSISVLISTGIGYISGEMFVDTAHNIYGVNSGEGGWREEFIRFGESYIWVSAAILFLLLCTYVYEHMGLAPKGLWTAQSRRTQEEM